MRVLAFILALVFSGFVQADSLPNKHLTPGVFDSRISTKQVCEIKWSEDQRHVTQAMKATVFKEYGFQLGNKDSKCIQDSKGRRCEVDHLISRQLGGADDIRNLFPQPYGGVWNAVDKDRVENKLHDLVCSGKISLRDAQNRIANDWVKVYIELFGDKYGIPALSNP